MSQPLLTVVITSYNYARYLPICIESILGQDFCDFELFVLDNCSSDATQAVMQPYLSDRRVHYVRHARNMGSNFNWAMTTALGSGRYFAHICADDFILPGHFSKLINLLQTNPHCVLAYSATYLVDQDSAITRRWPFGPGRGSYAGGHDDHAGLLGTGNYVLLVSALFDRLQIGSDLYLDPDALGLSDFELCIRLAGKYRHFAYDETPSACYRKHAAAHSMNEFLQRPEGLYGHLFIYEQQLPTLSAAQWAQHGDRLLQQAREFVSYYDFDALDPAEQAHVHSVHAEIISRSAPFAGVAGRVALVLPFQVLVAVAARMLPQLAAQTYRNWECIVPYDGSAAQLAQLTELMQPLIKMPDAAERIVFLQCDAIDFAEALNAGVAASTGAFILALDAGCDLAPDVLAQVLARFEQQTTLDIVHCTTAAALVDVLPLAAMLQRNPVDGYAVYRRPVFRLANRYSPAFEAAAVLWDFWIHALKRGARMDGMAVAGSTGSTHAVLPAPHARLTAATLAYAHLLPTHIELLRQAVLCLIELQALWRPQNLRMVARQRAYSTVIALDYLAKINEPALTPRLALPAPVGEQYVRWILDARRPVAAQAAVAHMAAQTRRGIAVLALVLDLDNRPALVQQTLHSLQAQDYPATNILVLSTAAQIDATPGVQWLLLDRPWQAMLNLVAAQIDDDWLYLLYAGDCLEPMALLALADAVAQYPDLHYVYADQDTGCADGTVQDPVFKPALNLDLLRSTPYVGRNVALARPALLALGGLAVSAGDVAVIDVLFKVIEQGNFAAVAHLDVVLCHTALAFADWCGRANVVSAMLEVSAAHLTRLGYAAQMVQQPQSRQQVLYCHAERAVVSIVIDANAELALLQRCVASIFKATVRAEYAVLIVAPSGARRDAQAINDWLATLLAPEVTVLAAAGSTRAARYRHAAQQARGAYLLFLDAGVAVLNGDYWLDALLNHALRPEVGVVGAKLIDQQKNMRAAALVLGLSGVDGGDGNSLSSPLSNPLSSPFLGTPFESDLQHGRLLLDQNCAAVDGACLMVRKSLFDALDGFDPVFANTYYAADLCLRIGQAACLVVWTPHVVLLSEPSTLIVAADRLGMDDERQAFYRRYWQQIGADPAYNRNLALHRSGFEVECRAALRNHLALLPMRKKIWLYTDGSSDYRVRRVQQRYQALADSACFDLIISAEAFSLSELARMAPDSIVVHGVIDARRLAYLSRVRAVAPLSVIYEPLIYDPLIVDTAQAALLALVDRVIVHSAKRLDAYAAQHADVVLSPLAQMAEPWHGLLRGSSLPVAGAKPRVGLNGDIDLDAQHLMAQVCAELGDEIELIVFAHRYPLALQAHVQQYQQRGPLPDDDAALLAELQLDLALLPDSDAPYADWQRLLYAAQGIAVTAVTIAPSAAAWVAAIRQALSAALTPSACVPSDAQCRQAWQQVLFPVFNRLLDK